MTSRLSSSLSAAAFAVVLLAGCSSPGAAPAGGSSSAAAPSSSAPASSPAAGAAALKVTDSALGRIVVDAEGKTVYMFDKDTKGADASVCSGDCATAWPAVPADSDAPAVDGVTGDVGTISGVDGKKQLTLNGWPLYYFAKDAKAGDTLGQGVGKVWWVLTPAGEKIGS